MRGDDVVIVCQHLLYITTSPKLPPCSFVYTRTARGHEQSAFKPIVMEGYELSNINNPLLPLPVGTIEARGCC